jgi:hypothetical protein
MMDQARYHGAVSQSHAQSLERQLRIDVTRESPADAAPTVSVDDDSKINKLSSGFLNEATIPIWSGFLVSQFGLLTFLSNRNMVSRVLYWLG